MAETSNPVRTCVGCRKRATVDDLLRVVVVAGALVPDPRRVLPGRGASLHPTEECLRAAERRRAFSRALRCSTPLEAGPLRDHVLDTSSRGAADADRIGRQQFPVGPAPGRSARRQDTVG
ncbi:YlxR family protein [Blastococcus saxobsidens]|uniref:YlxR family protein n=1 Tax=Blastococcus saxobsidens TaxID=138336 RepID=UPI000CEC9FAB|nr:YlxR family protein [Blastococcus saxobsidens]